MISTGYGWKVFKLPSCLSLLGRSNIELFSNAVGAGGIRGWLFKAHNRCLSQELILGYGRPWDRTSYSYINYYIDIIPRPRNEPVGIIEIDGPAGTNLALSKYIGY